MIQVRHRILSLRIRGRPMDRTLRRVLRDCHVSDWFVLDQICRNVNSYFFREFLCKLQYELKIKPDAPEDEEDDLIKLEKENHDTLPMKRMETA